MKTHPKPVFQSLAAIAAVFVCFSPIASAQDTADLKFTELKKKLNIDQAAVKTENGALASYAPALKRAMPAVVTIFSTREAPVADADANGGNNPGLAPDREELFRRMFPDLPEDFFDRAMPPGHPAPPEQGLGSGVIISEDGYILTNNHVSGGNGAKIRVTIPGDKKEYEAKLIGADPKTDVALIKIDAQGLRPITIADSKKLQVGDVVMAVGNPFGLEQTVTHGIVSALGRNSLDITGGGYENFIQTDASINRGNSGGALVDAQGRLVGINTAIQSGMTGGNIGIGFAIPSTMALNIVERLLDGGGVVRRGFLGVYLRELDTNFANALGRDDRSGVLVTEVGPGSPADKGGLKAGDLILKFNEKEVDSMPRLRLDISNTPPGSDVEFLVIRNRKEKKVKVTLGDLEARGEVFANRGPRPGVPAPEPVAPPFLEGVKIKDLDDKLREMLSLPDDVDGILVESVTADSPAGEAGLEAGHVITQVDQQDVNSSETAKGLLKEFDGDVMLLQVYSEGRHDILAIPLKGE
ncbi:MAG: Do family serine endopeptidase [Verrucomicrobiales bacterium]|nr:Do family serine endopeptidase [Verrucomicrobiales bacterium]